MKKHLVLLVALLLGRLLLPAQRLPDYTVNDAGYMWFSYPCTGLDDIPHSSCRNKEDMIKTEYPAWIIGGGWRTYVLTDGGGSSLASSPASMITSTEINFHSNGGDPVRITDKGVCPDGIPWKLNYYCAYSAQYINHPTAGTVSLAFVEGENHIQTSVGKTVDCNYTDWDGHSTYLCAAWVPNNQNTNWGQQYFTNEMGPIIWPATGYYLPNGQKSSGGCANNSTILADDGYLYVFYKDQSYEGLQMGDGRLPGIKVARAPISDALNPYAYQTYYHDDNGDHWNPSLPAGFNKDNIGSFYTSPGPQGTVLVEGNRDYQRFAVAKVAGGPTPYYLAVGYYPDPDDSHKWVDANGKLNTPVIVNLKYSYNLLQWWGDRTIYTAPNDSLSHFHYPIFLRNDGWTNTTIDENDFYVVGTNPEEHGVNNAVFKLHVFIYTPPPPPVDPVCYDNAGNIIDCSNQVRKATNGATEALDNSKNRAPFVYPNPGPGVYRLQYSLQRAANTQVNIVDLLGRRVQTGATINRTAGTYTETINISGQAKGVYLLELQVNGKKQTFKVIYQ